MRQLPGVTELISSSKGAFKRTRKYNNALNSKGKKEIKKEIEAIKTAVDKLDLAMTRLTELNGLENAPMSEVNNLFRRGHHV